MGDEAEQITYNVKGVVDVVERNRKFTAPALSDAVKAQIAQSMVPVRQDEVMVIRGKERTPLASVRCPALTTFLMHGAKLIRSCAKKRNLETDLPGALRIHRTAVTGYVTAEPVAKFDSNAADQYELKWDNTKTRASINLLPVLQPRNLEVAEGFVMEIPVSLEMLNNSPYLVLHLGDAHTREEEEGPPRKKKSDTSKNTDTKSGEGKSDQAGEEGQKPAAAQLPED